MYNSGIIVFDNENILLSPVGNKINCFDMINGSSYTLPIESRSNISLIDISPDNRIIIVIDVGNIFLHRWLLFVD